ncbi:aldose epimerase family protein [Virgibacillus necropolis]|uniref:Aldose 1-epimerase n=1 Tax=Virgibacillus necropolis TaxID=163877 RepID=A0A221M927_9BACI|nr:aldose epimerase family protein [Virgibacillus necropolis]ASN04154.1 galactose-1-epimerase [Virgibacillus necropolis]
MNIEIKDILGKWKEFTLANDQGMSVSVLDFGGIITKVMVPDQKGKMENVVLGYKNYADYETNPNFFGAIVGRIAGRIQDASFETEGQTYSLEVNDGNNHLHGGSNGFSHFCWAVEPFHTKDSVGLKLTHFSADGDGGYPGNVDVAVTYTLNNENELIIDYYATTDQTTPLALTNHSYFNLNGNLKNTVHNHHITIDSSNFVELDESLIPTGRLVEVSNSTFDFREGRVLSDGFEDNSEQHKITGNGYDHYFIFDNEGHVVVKDGDSGRVLTIETDQPGMVMYTANGLTTGLELREGSSRKYLGVCFETQGSPASLHHVGFPNVILEPEFEYNKRTKFSFGVE